jgi:hypothetical protein
MSAKQSTYKLSRSVKIETKKHTSRMQVWNVAEDGGWGRRWVAGSGSARLEDGAARGNAGLEDGAARGSAGLEEGGIGPQIGRGFVMGSWEEGDLSVWVWERCGDSTAG